jgi:hypothetical protein
MAAVALSQFDTSARPDIPADLAMATPFEVARQVAVRERPRDLEAQVRSLAGLLERCHIALEECGVCGWLAHEADNWSRCAHCESPICRVCAGREGGPVCWCARCSAAGAAAGAAATSDTEDSDTEDPTSDMEAENTQEHCVAVSQTCDYEALCGDLRLLFLARYEALAECVACRRFEPDLVHIPWGSCDGCAASICGACLESAFGGARRDKKVYCEPCADSR